MMLNSLILSKMTIWMFIKRSIRLISSTTWENISKLFFLSLSQNSLKNPTVKSSSSSIPRNKFNYTPLCSDISENSTTILISNNSRFTPARHKIREQRLLKHSVLQTLDQYYSVLMSRMSLLQNSLIISARGVDYPGVTKIIQVGAPTSRDIYIHRIGRTGRAGKMGDATLIL